jgi:hypothetical protein
VIPQDLLYFELSIIEQKLFFMKLNSLLLIFLFTISASSLFSQALSENFSLIVSEPAGIAGSYDMNATHVFGPGPCAIGTVSGEVVLAAAGEDTEACENVVALGLDVDGKIALIDRGSCDFIEKVNVVQQFGAIAAIICNNVENDTLFTFGASEESLAAINITIPTFSMRLRDCTTLKTEIAGGITAVAERLPVGFIDDNSDDEVFWSEDFAGGFNGWTPEGLFCGNGQDPGGALWQWRSGGRLGEGRFTNPATEMISKSACDGFIVFDSDFLDNAGTDMFTDADAGIVGAGDCTTPHEGIITSPSIDLSATGAAAGDFIGLKFSQTGRQFLSTFLVEWSTDGGTTWDEREVNNEVEANDVFGNIQRFPLSGVTSSDNLILRFRFFQDYYTWGIDDVELIKFVGINAQIENTFYTPLSAIVPITHADADTFAFSTDVINNGAEPIDVRLDIEVVKVLSGLVVHTDEATETGIPAGDTVTVTVEDLWVPNEIDTGAYRIDYDLTVLNGNEADTGDNSESFFFAISEGEFGKALGIDVTALPYRASEDDQWGLGAVFPTANGVGRFAAEEINFSVFTPDGATLQNFIAEVALLKMVATDLGPLPNDFDRQNNSYLSHPNLEVVFQTTHVFSANDNIENVTIDLSGQGIDPLEAGTRYVVMVFFDDNNTSSIGSPNNDLFLLADDSTPMSGTLLYLPDRSPSWFTGFTGFTPAPLISLGIALTSPVDEVALPDEVFKAFPNPAHDFINAQLDFQEPTDVSLIIANIEGRILSVQNENSVTKRDVQLDVSIIPNGTYLLRVATNEGTKTTQIIVQH